ncbi:MAG: uroporphyrinogen decarboxylase family protein [Armatimonadota bacterium]
MTGLERILAAFSEQGTDDFPAVACYPGILSRDHYFELTDMPWWTVHDPNPAVQLQSITEQNAAVGFDWYGFGPGASREEQEAVSIVVEGDEAFRLDRRTGEKVRLEPPVISGTLKVLQEHYPVIDDPAAFLEEKVVLQEPFRGLAPGEDDLPRLMMASPFGQSHFAYYSVGAAMWGVSSVMGYEQFFAFLATDPEPIFAAAQRYLYNSIQRVQAAAAAGCHGIWIEDCMMDMIGPERYAKYNLPVVQELAQAIRDAGMKSMYYFCGNPWPVMDLLLETGADALSLEESKKGFSIDIEDVVARTQGRVTVLGNLDAIDVLEHGSLDDLRREVARQLDAGRRNNGRFIMSTGSPVTPGTTITRLHEYISLVRELSG